jgi:hypothetical protein
VVIAAAFLVGACVVAIIAIPAGLRTHDAPAIHQARRIAAFVQDHCGLHGTVPNMASLREHFRTLPQGRYWHVRSDGRKSFSVQYPMNWWNDDAIGDARLSPFTATPYSYLFRFTCSGAK